MNIKVMKTHPDAILPKRSKPGDSGLDLYALMTEGSVWIAPGERAAIRTGIAVELPEGHEAQVRSRSGLTRQGIVACGGLGTVDNGYRGEVGVTLFNHSVEGYMVHNGDRIAQLVVCPVAYPDVVEVTELSQTERGAGGFGSTGV